MSLSSQGVFFNKVSRLLVAHFYDKYAKLPETDEDWEAELRGFIENYGSHALVPGKVFTFM